jgi:hypothetical protein
MPWTDCLSSRNGSPRLIIALVEALAGIQAEAQARMAPLRSRLVQSHMTTLLIDIGLDNPHSYFILHDTFPFITVVYHHFYMMALAHHSLARSI